MSTSLTERVVNVISKSQRIPASSIAPSSTFDELGIDSLGALSIAFDLELEFNIQVPEDALDQVRTVSDLIEGVRALTAPDARVCVPAGDA